jgi:uncharacterized RDD family membrane protein YckC
MHEIDVAPGWRRLAAFAIDYGVIAVYAGLLAGVSLVVRRMLGVEAELPTTVAQKLAGQASAFCAFTLPIVLYFAFAESSRWRATLGKTVMSLRVTTLGDQPVSLKRSLLRSAIKFAPWELAHTAVWHVPDRPFVSEPSILNWIGWLLAMSIAVFYVLSLFVGARRTPYDWVSGTEVVSHR